MQRYFLVLAYQGTAYHGWQAQCNATSIQATLEQALSTLCRQPIALVGSSRTDTGVHAQHQVAHVDLPASTVPDRLLHRLNALLPPDISALGLHPVPADTHARFAALHRRYVYRLHQRKDPFLREVSCFFPQQLDVAAMHTAAQQLLGVHDFQSFSRVKTNVAHFRCHLTLAQWQQKGHELTFTVQANRFLRGMVRTLVGSLVRVGTGQWTAEDLTRVLEAKDRRQAGIAVPAHGLHLMEVGYPTALALAN